MDNLLPILHEGMLFWMHSRIPPPAR